MNKHRLTIKAGKTGHDATVLLDGEDISSLLFGLSVRVGVNDVTVVVLEARPENVEILLNEAGVWAVPDDNGDAGRPLPRPMDWRAIKQTMQPLWDLERRSWMEIFRRMAEEGSS